MKNILKCCFFFISVLTNGFAVGQQVITTNGVAVPTPVTAGPQNGYRYVNGQWVQAPPAQQYVVGGQQYPQGDLLTCRTAITAAGAVAGALLADKKKFGWALVGGVGGYVIGGYFCPESVVRQIAGVPTGTTVIGTTRRVEVTPSKCVVNGQTFLGLSDAQCFQKGEELAKKETKTGCGVVVDNTFTPNGKILATLNWPGHPENGQNKCISEEEMRKYPGKFTRVSS
jgi:hypothetical protein